MNDELKTKLQLITELTSLRKHLSELEGSEIGTQPSEEPARQDEDEYRSLAENIPAVVYRTFLRKSMNMTFYNDMLRALTGYTADEIRHGDVCSLYHLILPDDRENVLLTIEQSVLNKQPFQVQYRLRHKDGSLCYFAEKGRPLFDEDGKPLYIEGVIFDNTEYMLTDESLRETHERYRSLVETIHDWIWEVNTDGCYTYVSPRVHDILGYDPSSLLGKPLFDLVSKEEAPRIRDLFKKMAASGKPLQTMEKTCVHKDGHSLTIETNGAPFFLPDGKIMGYRGMDRDVSERSMREGKKKIETDILHCLSSSDETPEMIHDILALLKKYTGFEALAIRLRDGDDFPYFATDGLSEQFVDKEKYLCSRDDDGKLILDSTGKPYLECICGDILSGRTKPGIPCITNGGSFWTNSTSDLLASTPPENLQSQSELRKNCINEGYESVAVIPIPGNREMMGLLQLLDKRRDLFSEEMMSFLEEIGKGIGSVLNRRHGQMALQKKCDRYQGLVETTPGWIWETDRDYILTYVSPQVRNLLGYDPQELLYRTVFDLMPAEEATRVGGLFKEKAEAERPVEFLEHVFIHKNGHPVMSETAAVPYIASDGSQQGFRGLSRDIGTRKASDDLYRMLADQCPAAIYIVQESVFKYFNPGGCAIIGYRADEIVGKEPASLVLQEDHDLAMAYTASMLSGERTAPYEFRIMTKEGHIRWVTETVASITYEGNAAVLGAFLEVTAYKKQERQALHEMKMESLGDLSSGIAQEVNHILAAVTSYTEIARDEITSDSSHEKLDQVLQSADRGRYLIERILTFGGRIDHARNPVDINAVVKTVLESMRSTLPTAVEVRQFLPAESFTVSSDPEQIRQIVTNLCNNAVYAMRKQGGILECRITKEDVDRSVAPVLSSHASGPFIKLTVSDTGTGIDPAVIDRVFDPFFTDKTPGEGVGLGLALVYAIVRDLGGSLSVASEQGKGSIFTVYLPCASAPLHKDTVMLKAPRGTERILFVDDNESVAKLGDTILNSLGYQITTMTNAAEALDHFRTDPVYDLIIIDMAMPDITGMDLAREISNTKPDTPIILCKGQSEIIPESEATKVGIREFILKPLFRRELAGVVRAVLDSGKTEEPESDE